jgi:hypothetical protein
VNLKRKKGEEHLNIYTVYICTVYTFHEAMKENMVKKFKIYLPPREYDEHTQKYGMPNRR